MDDSQTKKNLPEYKIPFENLVKIFYPHEKKMVLNPNFGTGSLVMADLEYGIKARIWDCSLNQSLEFYNGKKKQSSYYSLVFFSKSAGLQLADRNKILTE